MRILYTLLITATVALLHVLDNPVRFQRLLSRALGVTHDTLWTKDVRIEGLKALSRIEVERVLPMDRSVAWWQANLPVVQAKVAENPWIGAVAVEPCPDGSMSAWNCFVVSITEREPAFLVAVDDERWLVSKDGTFLRPVPPEEDQSGALERAEVVGISGLASRVASPDLVRAQLALALESITVLEEHIQRKVGRLDFKAKGDISVHLVGLNFPILFSTSSDAGVPLAEQAERCRHLLAHIAHRAPEIDRVDLAFSRVGIVKFRGVVEATR